MIIIQVIWFPSPRLMLWSACLNSRLVLGTVICKICWASRCPRQSCIKTKKLNHCHNFWEFQKTKSQFRFCYIAVAHIVFMDDSLQITYCHSLVQVSMLLAPCSNPRNYCLVCNILFNLLKCLHSLNLTYSIASLVEFLFCGWSVTVCVVQRVQFPVLKQFALQ